MKKLNPARLFKKRRNSGFTLVEVIISCALLGILVFGVFTFASPIMDLINTGKKSARATGLSETIDAYIVGTLRNSIKTQVIQNTSFSRIHSQSVVQDSALGLEEIYDFMCATDLSTGIPNATKYEVRCLGICWVEDKASPQYSSLKADSDRPKKQMLLNIKLKNIFAPGSDNSGALMPEADSLNPNNALKGEIDKVFDDSLYNGLYPVINVETFKAKDVAGNETATNANGYKITADIYGSINCYNTVSQAERDRTPRSFRGVSYVEFINPDPNKDPVANDVNTLNDTQNTIDANMGSRKYVINGTSYYYPDTYIYYVVPKS